MNEVLPSSFTIHKSVGRMQWSDLGYRLLLILLGLQEIMAVLQVHPDPETGPTEHREPQCGRWRHPSAASYDLTCPLKWNLYCVGKLLR